MKIRLTALILCILLLAFPLLVDADGVNYDINALKEYANVWDKFFEEYKYPYYTYVDYLEDNSPYLGINLAASDPTVPMELECDVFMGLFPDDDRIIVILSGKSIDTVLKNVRFVLESQVVSAAYVTNDLSDEDPYWWFELDYNSWNIIRYNKDITVLFDTNNGVRTYTLFTSEEEFVESKFIDFMALHLFSGYDYSSIKSPGYKKASALPNGTNETDNNSSLIEKYYFSYSPEDIQNAAQSMFYVEVYNDQNVPFASGSGFVAFDEHCFITNHHVIEDAAYLVVYDDENDDSGYKLTDLIVADKEKDIAILSFPAGKCYRSLPLGTSEKLMRGQQVIVIGSPKGIKNTVSNGIISALLTNSGFLEIQFTAAISPGSSGGALFNDKGSVIGLVFAKHKEGENMNYAIDINEVIALKEKAFDNPISLLDYNYSAVDQTLLKNKYISIDINSIISTSSFTLKIDNLKEETIIEYELYITSKDPSTIKSEKDIALYTTVKKSTHTIAPLKSVTSQIFSVQSNPVYVGIKQIKLSDGRIISYKFDTIRFIKIKLANPTPIPTPKPTATPKPTSKPTATPKPTARRTATPKPTAKPTKAKYLSFKDVQGEYDPNSKSMRVYLRNDSKETVVEYTLCYGTTNITTLWGALSASTKTITQTIPPGVEKYSGYFPIDISNAKEVYVGIKQVKLSNGKTINYDRDEMVYSVWKTQ